MFCPQCGNEFSGDDVFCAFCGAELDAVQTKDADGAENPFKVGAQTTRDSDLYEPKTQDVPTDSSSAFKKFLKDPDLYDPNVEVPTGPFSAFKICFKKYAVLRGRASRAEYCYWVLFTFLTVGIPIIIGFSRALDSTVGLILITASLIWALACLLPTIYMMIRRVHDINISFKWLFLLFFPYVNFLVLLLLAILPGTRNPNQYGPPPMKRRTPESSETT